MRSSEFYRRSSTEAEAALYYRKRGMKLLLPAVIVAFSLSGAIAYAADAEIPVPPKHIESAKQAKASFERGDYAKAEAVYLSMLADLPENPYVLSNLGMTRLKAGKLELADEVLRRAIAVASKDDFSHCTLGIVLYTQGRQDEAINALTAAVAINRKNATAHRYLGLVAGEKGWHEAARKQLEKAQALEALEADRTFRK